MPCSSFRTPVLVFSVVALVGPNCKDKQEQPAGGTKLYVVHDGEDAVTVLDGTTLVRLTTIAVGTSPGAMAVDDAHERAYVANAGSGSLSVIDTRTDAVVTTVAVGGRPTGVAVDVPTRQVYVTDSATDGLAVVDGATNSLVERIEVGSGPVAVAVHGPAGKVFVANAQANSVTILSMKSNRVLDTIATGSRPSAVAADPATSNVYVVCRADNRVEVIDTLTDTIVNSVDAGTDPVDVAVNLLDDQVYVANSGSGTLTVFNAAPRQPFAAMWRSTIEVQGGVDAVTVDPLGSFVYVASRTDGTVTAVDSRTPGSLSSGGQGRVTMAAVAPWTGPSALAVVIPGRATTPPPLVPDVGITWRYLDWRGDPAELESVATDGLHFVGVGANGQIRATDDGLVWKARDSGTASDLKAVAFLDGRFVAVGANGAILLSSDTVSWVGRDSGTSQTLFGLTASDAGFLVVGAEGTLVSSVDGEAWTARSIGASRLNAAAFGDGLWVVVGDRAAILMSSDGITFDVSTSGVEAATFDAGEVPADLHSVLWTGSLFVATGGYLDTVSDAGVTVTVTSVDGVTWASQFGTASVIGKTTLVGGQLITAVPEEGALLTSTDGLSWASRASGVRVLEIAAGASRFVAVGPSATRAFSADGLDWVSVENSPFAFSVGSAAADESGFMALADCGWKAIFVADGAPVISVVPRGAAAWDAGTGRRECVSAVRWLDGHYVTVSGRGRVAMSTDGVWYSEHFVPGVGGDDRLTAAAWGHGLYVVVGTNETIATSADGEQWTVRHRVETADAGGSTRLNDVTFIEGSFYAVGGGLLLSSPDGLTWSVSHPQATHSVGADGDPGQPSDFVGLARGNGVWMLIGTAPSVVFTSTDGVTWNDQVAALSEAFLGKVPPELSPQPEQVLFVDDRFYLRCGYYPGRSASVILSSTDGIRWVARYWTQGVFAVQDMAYRPGRLFATGSRMKGGGVMITSP